MSPFVLVLKSELIFSTLTINGKQQVPIELDETFFGVGPNYKIQLYDQMFDFVYYSEGAFSLDEVRSWPITLRLHYLKRLQGILEEKSKQAKKAQRRR